MTKLATAILPLLLATGVAASDQAKKLADLSLDELIVRVKQNENEAVLELGRRGDKSVVPLLLDKLEQNRKNFGSVGSNAEMALAKLGERKYLDQIIFEVHDSSPAIQWKGIRKLAYVGGDVAIRELGPLLMGDFELRPPIGRDGRVNPTGCVWHESASMMAARVFPEFVQDIPRPDRDIVSQAVVFRWRMWWLAYKESHGIKD